MYWFWQEYSNEKKKKNPVHLIISCCSHGFEITFYWHQMTIALLTQLQRMSNFCEEKPVQLIKKKEKDKSHTYLKRKFPQQGTKFITIFSMLEKDCWLSAWKCVPSFALNRSQMLLPLALDQLAKSIETWQLILTSAADDQNYCLLVLSI